MNIIEFSLLIAATSLAAGVLGALTGMGGGIVIVPVLTLVFGVDIHYAIGASLVSVIATSSGAASAYVKQGFTNIRLGLFLEIATTTGAIVGALLATRVSGNAIALVFGVALIYSAAQMLQKQKPQDANATSDRLADRLRLGGSYPSDINSNDHRHTCPSENQLDSPSGDSCYTLNRTTYGVRNVPTGVVLMFVAGAMSGLLGIGSGALKVLAMDRAMRVPFKVSTTTSNFMIGVTAAASAGIYFSRGYIDPGLAMPVMLGVLGGSMLGAKLLVKATVNVLKVIFAIVVFVLAGEMLVNGWLGRIGL